RMMKNRVTARSRTAIAERLKFDIWPLLISATFVLALAPSCCRWAPSEPRLPKERGPLIALLLAYDWFGDSFLEASRRLGGKPTGRFLRILKFLERIDSAPPQGEHVETAVDVRPIAAEQRCGAIPLGKHGGVPGPALHPDVVDGEMESGQDTSEALEPTAQGFFVVALATERVGAGNTVMHMRRDCLHRFIPAMVVDMVEGLSDLFLDNVAVQHSTSPTVIAERLKLVSFPCFQTQS